MLDPDIETIEDSKELLVELIKGMATEKVPTKVSNGIKYAAADIGDDIFLFSIYVDKGEDK